MSQSRARAEFLRGLFAAHHNTIRFDEWMRAALYDPQWGYYAANIRAIGSRGDFTTWPERDSALAEAIARWVRRHRWSLWGQPIMEIGPGSGALAAALWRCFRWWEKPSLALVETSPRLQALQRQRLGRHGRWFVSAGEALARWHGQALIFANELLDALPCRVFRHSNDGWLELHVSLESSKVQLRWLPAAALPDSLVLRHPWATGQIVEVHECLRQWFASWRGAWERGRMVLIDYGDEQPERIYFRRPHGTLRAYAFHQRLEFPDILEGFGWRDLTADVCFADVRRWASQAKLASSDCMTLSHFLGAPPAPELDTFRVVELWPADASASVSWTKAPKESA